MSTKRLLRYALGAAPLIIAGLITTAGQAAAHNTLVSASPADGARLPSGPPQVTLIFDQPVQQEFSTVTVTGPDGNRWEAGEPAVSGNQVTAPVRPLGPAGDYVVGFRVVSGDGHPVSGNLRFTLTAAGTGTAAGPPDAAAGRDGGAPVWPWIVGAVLLLLAGGVLLALRLRRPAGPRR